MDLPWLVVLVALLALNSWASLRVLSNSDAPAVRRLAQLALVWLVPVVGPVLCLVFLAGDTNAHMSVRYGTEFADNTSAGDPPQIRAPGSSLCGCAGSDGGASDGGGD